LDSIVGIAEMLVLNNQISKFCQRQEICLFSKMSRLAVDPTWPIQWVTATLSSGVKQLWHYADQLHPLLMLKWLELCFCLSYVPSWHVQKILCPLY